jgi:hypothetical protein
MSFPNSPSNGQITVVNGIGFQYSSATNTWTRINAGATNSSLTLSGSTDSTSSSSGTLIVTGGAGIGANLYVAGNVNASNFRYSNGQIATTRYTTSSTAPANPNVGDQWYSTQNDVLLRYTYDGVGYYWVDITAPVISNYNPSAPSLANGSYSLNVTPAGTLSLTGNIIPSTTNTYSLGNSSNQFGSVYANVHYVGSSLLYANNTPYVNAQLPSYTGNITANTITVTGNVSYANGNTIGNKFISSNAAPVSPYLGDTWYQGSTDTLYMYVNDAAGNRYWMDISTRVGGNSSSGSTSTGTGVTSSLVYDLDDISGYTDGFNSQFSLSYNQNTSAVSVTYPWQLMVTINGLVQPAWTYNADTHWQSLVLTGNKGYTIINYQYPNGAVQTGPLLKFADPVPAGSQVMIRTVAGSQNTAPKTYPFKPVDIMLGAD